jgi:hypothetical protein
MLGATGRSAGRGGAQCRGEDGARSEHCDVAYCQCEASGVLQVHNERRLVAEIASRAAGPRSVFDPSSSPAC